MIAITDDISRAVEELLGRSSGPLHLRLVIQPIVASVLAIKAGLRDARAGRRPFFWTILVEPEERRRLFRSGWKDIGKLFTIAFLVDTAYQIFMLHDFHILQTLIVATAVAVMPYVTLRGIVTRFAGKTQPKAPPASRAA